MKYLSLLALLFSLTCQAATIEGMVVGIVDGDTITVQDARNVRHRIHLAGIEAPKKFQTYGQRAKDSMSELVFRQQVTVQTGKRDKYGREPGKVLVGGRDASLEQIKKGFAWHSKAYEGAQSPEDSKAFAAAQAEAKIQRVGLWRDSHPVPPWEFGKSKPKK
jgi:endonuclease YncB( thermonuclease family)